MTNNQRKETFTEVKQRITREQFVTILSEQGRDYTIKFFDLGLTNFNSLVHFYECENILEEEKQKKRKAAYEQKAKEKLDALLLKAPQDVFIDYYLIQNHSVIETFKHFSITESECLQLIKHYDCKKPKTVSKIISEKTKQEKYGSSTYNNREQAIQTCLEKYGVSNPSKIFKKTLTNSSINNL